MPGQPQASSARSQPARTSRREAGSQGGPGQARRPRRGAGSQGRPGEARRDVMRPLPDPVAIRLCRVPDAAPPYDDEATGEPGPGRGDALAAAIVAALGTGDGLRRAVDARAEDGPQAGPRPPKPTPPTRPPGTASEAGVVRRGDGGRPAPGPADWPSRFAQVLAETLAGSRPPAQIVPWTTERARSHIRRLGPLLTGGQRPLVQRVITSTPSAGVVEMSVVVGFGPRVRALAVRLERTRPQPATTGRPARQQRWVCTAVEAA